MGFIRNILNKRALKKDLKNKEKFITLYAVVKLIPEDEIGGKILAYKSTLNDAAQWVLGQLYKENESHYKSWCELREMSYESEDNFAKYVNECLGGMSFIDSKYTVQSLKLTTDEVVTICDTLLNITNESGE